MIERHITLNVHPGMGTELERYFAEDYRPPATQVPGFIACDLLREIEHPERYQMVFRWETADAAVAWRTSEVHQALQPALNALISSMEIVAYSAVG
jgi:heme-degrading monooxygenase HmoA